tara:strand:+ start:2144 stop:2380 length:237 start_codon:yes stop_codon:yes gene_type:complete
MITSIGNATVSICEDTAKCGVNNITWVDVEKVVEFIDNNNYVVDIIYGEKPAAEQLSYYTAGKVVDKLVYENLLGEYS